MAGFRYVPDVQAALEPWREKLGQHYDEVVSKLVDRDRALEDYATLHGTLFTTSTTRPARPSPGQLIYETDTGMVLVWSGTVWTPVSPRTTYVATTAGLAATATFPALVATVTVSALTYPTLQTPSAQLLMGGGTTNDQFELGIYDGATTAGTLLRAIRWTNQLNTNVDQRDVSSVDVVAVAANVPKTYTLWATRTAGAGTLAVTGDPRYSVFRVMSQAAG